MTSTVIQMRIEEGTKTEWQAKALEAGVTLSDWIRGRCEASVTFSLQECKLIHGTAVHDAAVAMTRTYLDDRDLLTSFEKVIDHLRVKQAYAPVENLSVLYLNKRNRLIADETLWSGTIDHAPIYPREIVKRALQLDAAAIIICHNHPSGDPSASNADIEATKRVKAACEAVGITLHDHLIVSAQGHASLRAAGLL